MADADAAILTHGPKEGLPALPKSGQPFRHQLADPQGDPWSACLQPLRYEDQVQLTAWKDEVQNLLIFAGLFSAVVTAFIIESYQNLKPDIDDQILFLLSQIVNSGRNDTSTPFQNANTAFSPPASSIRINIYWFMSLVLSLTAVLIGIISLQWLREYRNYPTHLTPQQTFAMQNMHAQGFRDWYVPQIFSSLPLLLQVALVLFLIGIAEFLLPLSKEVAWPVIAIAGVPLVFLLVTTVMPTLQRSPSWSRMDWTTGDGGPEAQASPESIGSQCPYKSPQSWAFYLITPRWVVSASHSIITFPPYTLRFLIRATLRYTLKRVQPCRWSPKFVWRDSVLPHLQSISQHRFFAKFGQYLDLFKERVLWDAEQEYPIHSWPAFSCMWLHNRNTAATGLWHADALTNPLWQYDAICGIDKLLAMNFPHDPIGASCVEQCVEEILGDCTQRLEGIIRGKVSKRYQMRVYTSVPSVWQSSTPSATSVDEAQGPRGEADGTIARNAMGGALYSSFSPAAQVEINALEILSCSYVLLREDHATGIVQAHILELILRVYVELFLPRGNSRNALNFQVEAWRNRSRRFTPLPYEVEHDTNRLWLGMHHPQKAARFDLLYVKLFEEFVFTCIPSDSKTTSPPPPATFAFIDGLVRLIHRCQGRALFQPSYPPEPKALILSILTNCHAAMTEFVQRVTADASGPQPNVISHSFGPLLASRPFRAWTQHSPSPQSSGYITHTLPILYAIISYTSYFRGNCPPPMVYNHLHIQSMRPDFAASVRDLVSALVGYQNRTGNLFLGIGDSEGLAEDWVSVQKEVLLVHSR